jgi:RNA polymerase sigma-70 factor (ECF subfamily)
LSFLRAIAIFTKEYEQVLTSTDTIQKRKFEILFREHFTGLCYFARKYTGDLDSAKEIVHNVFVRIWENRVEFEWDKPAKSYLFTSVYNRSLNYIRDNKKFISHEEAFTHQLTVDESVFSDNLETAELENRIKFALQKLPEKCREVFELSRFENKKYAEIADLMNLSVKTVETHMSKALHLLKEDLKDYLTLILIMMIKNLPPW